MTASFEAVFGEDEMRVAVQGVANRLAPSLNHDRMATPRPPAAAWSGWRLGPEDTGSGGLAQQAEPQLIGTGP